MALEIKLSKREVTNPEANRIYIKDITGNIGAITYKEDPDNLGSYISVPNTTGYGAPNALRNEVANILIGTLKHSTKDIDVEILPYSRVEDIEYTAKIKQDGWYIFNIISLPIVASTVEAEVYYDTVSGKIFKVIGGVATEINVRTLLNSIHNKAVVEFLYLGNTKIKKAQYNIKIIDLMKCNIDGCNNAKINRLHKTYDEIRGVLQAAVYEYCRGNKHNAQANVEYLNTQINELL